MDTKLTQKEYLYLLQESLIPALGCTEPIAIALAAAKARELLGQEPESTDVCCSGNIIKNVKGVKVPNSNGEKGILIAAALGIAGGDPSRGLEVLVPVDDAARAKAQDMVAQGKLTCSIKEGVDNLYVAVTMSGRDGSSSQAVIAQYHTRFVHLVQNGTVLLDEPELEQSSDQGGVTGIKSRLNVADILDFAKTADLTDFKPILERQVRENTAISDYGLANPCGAQIGRTLMACDPDTPKTRAKARAAAGSDARMSGCTLPVVINSGSGNQGLTVTMPVVEYAQTLNVGEEQLYRALLVSNLIALHQKYYIGNLSAFCGAVCAATGAGAAITYLYGGDYDAVSRTITNTLANVGGIVCDGAKASCAAKIASSVDAAIMGHNMSMAGLCFQSGDGLVQEDVEKTLRSVGYVGRVGMRTTDSEVLRIMTDKVDLSSAAI